MDSANRNHINGSSNNNNDTSSSATKELTNTPDSQHQFSSSRTETINQFFAQTFDLVCLSHLRWNFVYQRPQHLLSRAARTGNRVFFFEEPIFIDGKEPRLETYTSAEGVVVGVPHVPHGSNVNQQLKFLLDEFLTRNKVKDFVLWFYTPMALGFAEHLQPRVTIFDCMDELSAFAGASHDLLANEAAVISRADIMFTGGQSLYESKREKYPNHKSLHCFPSSIDFAHFAQARNLFESEPDDQKAIAHPRFGFFGVVDERFDTELLGAVAHIKPEWQFVIIGPIVKIDEARLPRRANIHYLGGKSYAELPRYIAGWDVATLLFARNESTRFISPTKTPEYLAAGKPVVSTSIKDVIRPYGENNFVSIADSPEDFVAAAEKLLLQSESERAAWLRRVDDFLKQNSWDITWQRMSDLIHAALSENQLTNHA